MKLTIILFSLLALNCWADIRGGDTLSGRMFIDGKDANKTCNVQILAAQDESERGVGCYSVEVASNISEKTLTLKSNIVLSIGNTMYCPLGDSQYKRFDYEFTLSSPYDSKEVGFLEFTEKNTPKKYVVKKLKAIFGWKVTECRF